MSRFNLGKKLQPAGKVWRSFKTQFQSKLRHPKFIKAIITLRQRLKVAYQSIFSLVHRKFLALTKRAPPHHHHHLHHHNRHHFHQSSSAIYVDELFPGPVQLVQQSMAESTSSLSVDKPRPEEIQTQQVDKVGAKVPAKGKAEAGESSKSCTQADKWTIPLVPQFRGIDERAEEFIAKFRQDMKLEREQSILEFEEMLKRSA